MKKVIALVTFLAALPGLAGIYLLLKLGSLPSGAVLIVVNAIVFRGVCGTAGGVLLWTGRRTGNYLVLVTWFYLIIVSVLTTASLYNKGLDLSTAFHDDQLGAFGKPLAWSVVKLVFGLPVIYFLTRDLTHKRKELN